MSLIISNTNDFIIDEVDDIAPDYADYSYDWDAYHEKYGIETKR
jgi:hypothetical protein